MAPWRRGEPVQDEDMLNHSCYLRAGAGNQDPASTAGDCQGSDWCVCPGEPVGPGVISNCTLCGAGLSCQTFDARLGLGIKQTPGEKVRTQALGACTPWLCDSGQVTSPLSMSVSLAIK